MVKKYWPIAVSIFLFQFVPLVMIHTRFKEYVVAYVFSLLGAEVLLLVAVLVVRRNRRKTTRTERL